MYGNESWGRFPKVKQKVLPLQSAKSATLQTTTRSALPFGQGRSYGDVCLNHRNSVVTTKALDNCIAFDRETGVFRAEAGITFADILEIIVPAGWFLPVSPGTQFVSLGGAIANDIHGKNHHNAGTFGRHVRCLELLRSDNTRIICSPETESDLFNATVAGLGLTGLILWAEVQLIPINNPFIAYENIKFANLQEFFEVSKESENEFDYTVAWLDCVSTGKNQGRGIFMRGNHAGKESPAAKQHSLAISPVVPFDFPSVTLNSATVKAFNTLYYHKQRDKIEKGITHYQPFFYPLDSVLHWNRIYGKAGFFQFQCVVASSQPKMFLKEVLDIVVASGQASFLAVLKEFGSLQSPGLLSFPRAGYTLCLDFPNRGIETVSLMKKLEDVVNRSDGALYPAKDACMSPATFRRCYPQIDSFLAFKDPGISSSFWRRVMEEA